MTLSLVGSVVGASVDPLVCSPLPLYHSSETTILAYGSNTLFISNRRSNVVYTVSSELGSVRANQVLATGSVPFANLEDIRDIVVASSVLQPLPGELW